MPVPHDHWANGGAPNAPKFTGNSYELSTQSQLVRFQVRSLFIQFRESSVFLTPPPQPDQSAEEQNGARQAREQKQLHGLLLGFGHDQFVFLERTRAESA